MTFRAWNGRNLRNFDRWYDPQKGGAAYPPILTPCSMIRTPERISSDSMLSLHALNGVPLFRIARIIVIIFLEAVTMAVFVPISASLALKYLVTEESQ